MGVGIPLEAIDESSRPSTFGLVMTRSPVISIRTVVPVGIIQIQVLLWIVVRWSGRHDGDVVALAIF